MAPFTFVDVIKYLYEIGIADVILPFLLVFVVVFALLQKSNIFKGHKGINAVFAFVVAMSVIFVHVMNAGSPYDAVRIINNAMPRISTILIAGLAFLMLIGLFFSEKVEFPGSKIFLTLFAICVITYIFGSSAGWWTTPGFLKPILTPENITLIVMALVFIMVVYFITIPSPPENQRAKWYQMGHTVFGPHTKPPKVG